MICIRSLAVLGCWLVPLGLAPLAATAVEPKENPWMGFPEGAFVEAVRKTEFGGKTYPEQREKTTIQSRSTDVLAQPLFVERSTAGGESESRSRFFPNYITGATKHLDELPSASAKVTIAGKTYPVQVHHWGLKRSRPIRDGSYTFGMVAADREMWSLKVYDATDEELRVPLHGLPTPSLNRFELWVGPRTLKIECSTTYFDQNGAEIYRRQITETVVDLDAERTVGKANVACTRTQIVDEIRMQGHPPHRWTGEAWYSSGVPGAVVERNFTTKGGRFAYRVNDFSVAAAPLEFDVAKLPALENRPAIPGQQWRHLHVGAWYASGYQTLSYGKRKFFFAELARVVKVNPDNSYLTIVQKITKDGLDAIVEHRLVRVPEDSQEAPVDDETQETVALAGEKIECLRRSVTTGNKFGGIRYAETWFPTAKPLRQRLAPLPIRFVRRRIIGMNRGSVGPSEHVDELFQLHRTLEVGGKELDCLEYRRRTADEKIEEITAYHPDVPTQQVSKITTSGGIRVNMVLDFGEAEKSPPSYDQLYELAGEMMKRLEVRFR